MAVKKKAKKAEKKTVKKKKAAKKEPKKKKAAKEKPKKEKGRKIKGIIFDFWGTLVENGVFPSPIRQVYRMLRVNMHFSDYIVPFEETFMTQKYDDLFHAFSAVMEKFGVRLPEFVKENMVGLWNKNKMFAKPYKETVEVLKQLKKDGYKIALISNTDCFSLPEVMEKYDIKKYFDSVVLSFEVGMLKSNPEMFRKILDEIGLKEDEVVMVGDSVESDVKAADNAGIKPILIDRRNRREFDGKILDLKELKGLIEKI